MACKLVGIVPENVRGAALGAHLSQSLCFQKYNTLPHVTAHTLCAPENWSEEASLASATLPPPPPLPAARRSSGGASGSAASASFAAAVRQASHW